MPKYYLANSNLFINGNDTTGTVKEFDVDNIKATTEKYESLGMLFDKDVPTGFQQMMGKMTFAGPPPSFFGDNSFPWDKTPFTLLGVMTDKSLSGSNNNLQFQADLIVRPTEIGMGKYEQSKLSEYERAFCIDKLTLSMGGVEKLAIDTENNIYRIDGVDKWAAYRSLMGQ